MQQNDENLLTTTQAMKRLNISRGTFFARVKEAGIQPANFNVNLRKQHNNLWRQSDIDKLGVPVGDDGQAA